MIYAIDTSDNTRDLMRAKTVDFFINKLGFEQTDIEFVDRTKFYKDQSGTYLTKFSEEE